MFTAVLIASLLVAGAATAVGGVLVWASGRQKLGEGDAAAPARLGPGDEGTIGERTPGNLRPGDVVQHGGQDFLVEGVLRYDEDGHGWSAARLVDGADERWLMVGLERVGPAALRLHQVDRELDLTGHPPEVLVVAGTRYRLERRGAASVTASGDVGPLMRDATAGSVLRCRWWRYEAPGGRGLQVEQWGAELRVLRGAALLESDLELMPGS